MESITLLFGITGSVFVFALTPVYGLIAYIIVLMWYPWSVTVAIGTIDFSASRIVMMALFASIYFRTNLHKKFKFTLLDKVVIAYFIAQIISGFTTTGVMKTLENRSGAFFDMALPYFAIRLIITDKAKYITFLKWLAATTALLALVAFFESVSGRNLLAFGRTILVDKRMGLFRAWASFGNPIYLGVYFSMAAAVCAGLLKNTKNSILPKIYICLIAIGIFASLSSGALMAAFSAIAIIVIYPFRKYWKSVIVITILLCLLVEIISNRHFYNVIDRLTFNSETAWYRARLFEVAFFEGGMSNHWLTGYGYAEPGWCFKIDGRQYTDMVNHYLLILCRYGLVGFIPFCVIIALAFKSLFKNFTAIKNNSDTWLIWCICSGLFGILMAFNSVSLFGQPMNFLFMTFGLCGSAQSILSKPMQTVHGTVISSNSKIKPKSYAINH